MPKKVVIKKEVDERVPKKIVKNIPVKNFLSKTPLMPMNRPGGTGSVLIENFVSLQKVLVNLSVKMDNLTNQISQLLNLFEISAKSLVERGGDLGSGQDKRMMEKLEGLADQNKTIARGVALLHEGGGNRQNLAPLQQGVPQVQQSAQGQMPTQPLNQSNNEEYQKSISSKPQEFNKLPRN